MYLCLIHRFTYYENLNVNFFEGLVINVVGKVNTDVANLNLR